MLLCAREYDIGGLTGKFGSMGTSRAMVESLTHRLKQFHDGIKLKHSIRAFDVVTNHRRCALILVILHPTRWNDITLFLYHHNTLVACKEVTLIDHAFELQSCSDDSIIIT